MWFLKYFQSDVLYCVVGDWHKKIASENFLAKIFGQVPLIVFIEAWSRNSVKFSHATIKIFCLDTRFNNFKNMFVDLNLAKPN